MEPDIHDVFIPLIDIPQFTLNIPLPERIKVAAELGAATEMTKFGRVAKTTLIQPLLTICGWRDDMQRAKEKSRTTWLAFPTSTPDDGSRSVLKILKMEAKGMGEVRKVSFWLLNG